LRDNESSVKKSRFSDIGDPSVDDHARVEDFKGVLARFFVPEETTERRQVEHVSLASADNQADVRHKQEHRQLKKGKSVRAVYDGLFQDKGYEKGAKNPENRTDGCTDQAFQTHLLQPDLKQNNG